MGYIITIMIATRYSTPVDSIQTFFKMARAMEINEQHKLGLIKEIGFAHMRIAEGLNSKLQLLGCISRMAIKNETT